MDDKETHPIAGPGADFVGELTSRQRQLYAFILSLVRNPADADDILQETNLVMWRKWAEFEPGTRFDSWAFTIARYQVMAYRKRKQRSKLHFDNDLVELLAAEAATEFVDQFDAKKSALSSCLRKLTDEQRRLIAHRYEPGGSVNEMAAKAGKSPKAVSEALRRIRKNLMSCIEKTIAEEGFA